MARRFSFGSQPSGLVRVDITGLSDPHSSYLANDRNDGGNPLAFLGFALLLVAPLLARVMQFAVSRRRESLADFSACHMTRYPPGLISALEKLQADNTVTHSASRATAHLWIEQPTPRREGEGRLQWINKMFDTHPPLEERIAALREL